MIDSASARRIRLVFAAAALCAALAGCVSDMASPTTDNSGAGNQPRYYGGPKSPMWSGQ